MKIKFYNPNKQVNKKYFGEQYRGTELLKSIEKNQTHAYRKFRKLSKKANRKEKAYNLGFKIGTEIAKGLEKISINKEAA
jgi:hypothetical protein